MCGNGASDAALPAELSTLMGQMADRIRERGEAELHTGARWAIQAPTTRRPTSLRTIDL
jgi:hypothetical protein